PRRLPKHHLPATSGRIHQLGPVLPRPGRDHIDRCGIVTLVSVGDLEGSVGVRTATASYKGHRYPVEIIGHCVWLYFRFSLSFRELMLAERVVDSYETTRSWSANFGHASANQLRRRRPRPGDKWHLDEVSIRINGK